MKPRGKKKKPALAERTHKRNLDSMKLLVSWEIFKKDIKSMRKEFRIPAGGFQNETELQKWRGILYKQSSNARPGAKNPLNRYQNRLGGLVKKYWLPAHFRDYIEQYLLINEIAAPPTNFAICTERDKEAFPISVSLTTYAKLTEKEFREAMKQFRQLQKLHLPQTATQEIKVRISIDKAIEIEKEMNKRINKTISTMRESSDRTTQEAAEGLEWYLQQVKKQYGEKEYQATKKLHPEMLKKEAKEKLKYTSKEIAKKFFGSSKKDALVRQIHSRIKRERRKRFGSGP